jgi:RND family efflux transporter MFP subunit
VQVAIAKTGPIRTVLTYSGAIQASQQVNVTPRATGQIASIAANVGQAVSAGDTLATLDAGTLPAQVQQASANLQSANARLAQMLGGGRAEDITAAQAAYDAAQAKYEQFLNPSALDIATAEAAVTTAQAALDAANGAITTAWVTERGAVSAFCNASNGQGLPCGGGVEIPLTDATVTTLQDLIESSIAYLPTTLAGAAGIDLINADLAYRAALRAVKPAEEALSLASARLAALRNPLPADVAAQKAAAEAARTTLAKVQQPYTDADILGQRAAVAQAQAALAIARTNLDQTIVTAPFDGTIAQRLLDVGASASPATPLFVLTGGPVEVHVSVDEARIGQIRPGLEAELSVPSFPGKVFKGKVATVAPAGDARAHTFDVKLEITDPDSPLRAGMFAEVGIVAAQKAEAVLIPNAAVLQQLRGATVFVVIDGKATQRTVTVGITDETNAEITAGVKAGEEVVVVGQNALRDGQAVRVTTPAGGSPAPTGATQPRPADRTPRAA